jgi:hypothetical protein
MAKVSNLRKLPAGLLSLEESYKMSQGRTSGSALTGRSKPPKSLRIDDAKATNKNTEKTIILLFYGVMRVSEAKTIHLRCGECKLSQPVQTAKCCSSNCPRAFITAASNAIDCLTNA